MIMFSLALTIFGASKNVSAQAQGHVTQYLYKGYKVTYTINSEWEDCYIASLTIESTGEYAIDNYALSFFMNDMIEEIWVYILLIVSGMSNLYLLVREKL